MLAPQKNRIEQLEKKLEEKKQMCDSALKASQRETRIQLNEQIEQLQSKLKNFVIDFKESTNLTFDISQIANEKEVTSFSIETKKGAGGDKKDKYVSESLINISFSTVDFNQFAALLNALERHRPVIFVDRFAITRSDKGSSEHRVKMNLAFFIRKMRSS